VWEKKGKTTMLKEVIRKLIERGARLATASPNNFKGMKTTSNAYIQELEVNPNYQICKVQKIGCYGDKNDWKYINLCNFSDSLMVNEIVLHI
jgi:hypothetical protein